MSFYGREDFDFQAKLRGELSGIAVRCVQAYRDLCEGRYFVQPRSAEVLEREVLEASDPFTAMVTSCFVADLEALSTAADLTNTAKQYLTSIGRPDEAARARDNIIIARLRGVCGFENVPRAPREHGKTRRYSGDPKPTVCAIAPEVSIRASNAIVVMSFRMMNLSSWDLLPLTIHGSGETRSQGAQTSLFVQTFKRAGARGDGVEGFNRRIDYGKWGGV